MSGATKLMTAGGGGVSLTPASSIASDVTVNVPSQNCTLGIQGPAFSAYLSGSNQGFSNGTWTKVLCNSEYFDTASCYDNTTNYRFQPTVPGYYLITGNICIEPASLSFCAMAIYKNGNFFCVSSHFTTTGTVYVGISDVIYMNGSTDYLELYGYAAGTSPAFSTSNTSTKFSGALVRAA